MPAIRLVISGRVQGVGFRAFVERQAHKRGVRGWVRNRRDGSVELLVTGSEEALAALIEACREGPSAAVVTGVKVERGEHDGSAGFSSRPTE